MNVRAVGAQALLAEVEGPLQAQALSAWLRPALAEAGIVHSEVVPAARTVLVDGLAAPGAVAQAEELLVRWQPETSAVLSGPLVEVPTVYDGEDLEELARLWEVSPEEVVARHTSVEFLSAFCGFAPGFAYLTGLPQEWAVPRLATPRPRVPAGSVAVAGAFSAVYPTASPGGWMLLGRTSLQVWDLARGEQPALLAPGTRVRFVQVRA